MAVLLQAQALEKTFGALRALQNVDFSLQRGEVRAVLGKNGAGKSTLINILNGALRPDAGHIFIEGRACEFKDPTAAMAAGIACVHQELTIIPGLSVAENIALGHWLARAGVIQGAQMAAAAVSALALLNEKIDVRAQAGALSLAQQQMVEIARALATQPKLLILDEPTSSLPAHEVAALLRVVKRLAQAGVAVIYVSHRMEEIARVADSVTVLRDGRHIATLPIEQATPAQLAHLMTGEFLHAQARDPLTAPSHELLLEVRDLSHGERVRNISLQLRKGEILGLAGLLGSGRTELLRCIAGADAPTQGQLLVHGEPMTGRSVQAMIRAGVALIPEDRKREGLVLGLPIRQNLVLSSLQKISVLGVMRRGREQHQAVGARQALQIKAPQLGAEVGSLSGGNQQKVVIARSLNADVDVLLLDEPTRGVDLQAKEQIYTLMRELARKGKAIVVVSSEYEELMLLCHRVLLLEQGRLVGEIDPQHTTLAQLMARLLRADEAAPAEPVASIE